MAERNSLGKQLNQRVQIHSNGEKEYWRDIPGWVGFYRVSDWGRVKSLPREVPSTRWDKNDTRVSPGKVLKEQSITKGGYVIMFLCKDGKPKALTLHSLVLTTFVGPRPEGMECRHLDGNPRNNKLGNLEWGTPKQNGQDTVRHGRTMRGKRNPYSTGSNHPGAKLTEEKVKRIRKLYKRRIVTQKQLADRFGVSVETIALVLKRRTWRHVL